MASTWLPSLRSLPSRARLVAFRSMRRAATWIEPRDPAHLTRRLDHGDIVWRAFAEAGSALVRCARFEEADHMLARGLAVFPKDPALLVEHALSAHNSGRYAIAIARWELALRTAPDVALCYCGLAANLRETGRIDPAIDLIEEGLRRFPDDIAMITEAARIAEAKGDYREALEHWQVAVARRDPHPDWLRAHANVLVRMGRFDEAEAALRTARDAHPNETGFIAVETILAIHRG